MGCSDMIQDIKRLEEVLKLYDHGVVPKENIKLDKYVHVPEDPSLQDAQSEADSKDTLITSVNDPLARL
eukprot:Seg1893.8 transcript_id=Seg1893.8/GoldUCD/mRNA.D3Y31 product="hypothetical protein" pseudo=true protein_id=Seg1893.8/GoldUCD/D3Y31